MKVLVVDDEPLARRGLVREVKRLPDATLVGECGTRDEAAAAIVTHQCSNLTLRVQQLPHSQAGELQSASSNVNMLLPAAIAMTCFPWL